MFEEVRPRSTGGLSRAGVLTILVGVALVVASALWFIGDQRGWFPAAGPDPTVSRQAVPSPRAGMQELLDRRAEAMRLKDRQAWLAGVDPDNADLQAQQGLVFDNMAQVDFDLVGYEYTGRGDLSPERGTELGPDAWVARVNLVYRIAGADTASLRREQYVTLVKRRSQWYITGFDDLPAGTRVSRDLWDLAPVVVTRGERSYVMSTSPSPQHTVVRRVDRAAGEVDAVWGEDWPRTVVVVVPTSQAEMGDLLGRRDQTGLDQIAAVTTGETGLNDAGLGVDRVIVNPAGFAAMNEQAAQLVLTHEVTHVATRSAGSGRVPIWLSEGFSDYVAFKHTDLTVWQRAGDLLTLVQQGRPPTRLPGPEEFDPMRHQVSPAYSASYLAVQQLVDTYGEDRVIRLYRTVLGAPDGQTYPDPLPIEQAMPLVLGVELDEFERQWLTRLGQDG